MIHDDSLPVATPSTRSRFDAANAICHGVNGTRAEAQPSVRERLWGADQSGARLNKGSARSTRRPYPNRRERAIFLGCGDLVALLAAYFSAPLASAAHCPAVCSNMRLLWGSLVFAANSAHSDALARYSSAEDGMTRSSWRAGLGCSGFYNRLITNAGYFESGRDQR
jgi:hypothetical protein